MKKRKEERVGRLFMVNGVQFNIAEVNNDSFVVRKPPMHTRINLPCRVFNRLWDVKVVKGGWEFFPIAD